MKHHALNLEALLKVPYVEPYYGPDVSPDGAQVAFSHNLSGLWEIYVMPLDGSAEARQLTAGPGGKFSPRWSPDGQRLAYVLDPDGGECFDLYVCDVATGRHTNLTPNTPDALQPNFCWSPDGSHISFISDRSGRFDTYLMPVTGDSGSESGGSRPGPGEAEAPICPAPSLPYPEWEVEWSPDGRWLAVVAETHGQDYGVFIAPVEGGQPIPIADAGSPIPARDAAWSPDGARIAFCSDVRGSFDVGVYELETGRVTWVTRGEGDKQQPAWSPDGRRLACVISRGPVTELAVLELGADSLTTYRVGPGIHHRPKVTPDGAHVLFVFDDPAHPDDLWLLSLADGSLRQLTHSLPADLRDSPFVVPESIRYPGLDGRSVPALLYRPRQAMGPAPAVVYIHGGPNWLTQVTWDPLVQHMVSRGWVVLAPNYRGSIGYGREWQLANRFDLGGGDTGDVVAGADYLVRQGLADPGHIAVTGRSYGGYLTMTSLTQYPDRWVGGSAVVPFLNWFTGHANSREDLQHWDVENFGDPEKDHDLYYERSPFFFLDRVRVPVQLICGYHDPRCPASESIQARDVLVAQGKPCDLLLYPDEGHSFLKTENVVDAEKRRVGFLAGVLESDPGS